MTHIELHKPFIFQRTCKMAYPLAYRYFFKVIKSLKIRFYGIILSAIQKYTKRQCKSAPFSNFKIKNGLTIQNLVINYQI